MIAMIKVCSILIVLLISKLSCAKELSNKALFYRCYKQLTQSFLPLDDARIKLIEQGSLDPITACLNVFDQAKLSKNSNGDYLLSDFNNAEAKNVLRTMHNVHFRSFTNRSFFPLSGYNGMNSTLYDLNGPALTFTRALFLDDFPFKEVFLDRTQYESYRSVHDPFKSTITNFDKNYISLMNPKLTDGGQLLGITPFTEKKYKAKTNNSVIVLDQSHGAGIIGSMMYYFMNYGERIYYQQNGTLNMPRRWGQTVINDFLCRELPVVRDEDVIQYLEPKAEYTFRHNTTCLKCHATADLLGGTLRNARLGIQSFGSKNAEGIFHARYLNVDMPDHEEEWPSQTDSSWHRRPPKGRFIYRSTDGKKLINEKLSSLNELGPIMTDIDDTYSCMVSKYYRYFTGIKVNLDNINDPAYHHRVTTEDIKHRNIVIELGKDLKKHQSLRTTVEKILKLPHYKDSEYKLGP